MSDGKDMFFRLYVPRNISAEKRYPLVMMLHGIGECGTDNRAQVDREDLSKQWMLDSVKTRYQAFVLYPQCPSSSYEWGNFNTQMPERGYAGLPAQAAVKVIDSLVKAYPIDTARLYVGGLSSFVRDVEKNAIRVVRVVSGRNMGNMNITLDSLRKAVSGGSDYLYTQITGGDHGSGWHEAFDSPVLVPWVVSKSKSGGISKFTWPAPGPQAPTAIAPSRTPAARSRAGKAVFGLRGGVPVLEVSDGDYSVAGKRLPLPIVPGR